MQWTFNCLSLKTENCEYNNNNKTAAGEIEEEERPFIFFSEENLTANHKRANWQHCKHGGPLKSQKSNFFRRPQIVDTLGRPTVMAGRDHCFCTCHPSIHPTFQNLAKQNKVKTTFATGEIVGLAEWIIDDDTCLVHLWKGKGYEYDVSKSRCSRYFYVIEKLTKWSDMYFKF